MLLQLYYEHDFDKLEEMIGVSFKDKELLVTAFVHPSYYSGTNNNYERLEFLGDSVLQIIVSEYMYKNNPTMPEGKMSRIRALLVSENSLAYVVRKSNMINFLQLGKSLDDHYDNLSNSYVADIFESCAAAIFLEHGIEAAKRFVNNELIARKEEILLQDFANDYKTKLQEVLQQNGTIDLNYECSANDEGFSCELFFTGTKIGSGNGKSKKLAQQMAAKNALNTMVYNENI